MKTANPGLKVLLALGGGGVGTTRFEAVSETLDRARTFSLNVVSYLKQHNFDGLDLDWEFPNRATRRRFQRLVKVNLSGLPLQ